MSRHILIVASGFGLRVIPTTAPYRFATDPNGSRLRVDVDGPRSRGGYVDPTHPEGLVEIADVLPGPTWNGWWLESSPYRVRLPPRWTAFVSGEIDPAPFDLVSADGGLIYIQTPRASPSARDLVARGQDLVRSWRDDAAEWVDVSYIHEGNQTSFTPLMLLVVMTIEHCELPA